MEENNGWNKWQMKVLDSQDRHEKAIEKLTTRIDCMENKILKLEYRVSLRGLIGGMIPAIGIAIWLFIKSRIGGQ